MIASYATYRSHDTCLKSCPFYGICYGYAGNVKIHAHRAASCSLDLKQYIIELPKNAQLRHLVVGDLALAGIDLDYLSDAVAGHLKRPDVDGVAYTHVWPYLDPTTNDAAENFTLNASCETDNDVRDALSLGWPAVKVVPRGYEPRNVNWSEVMCQHETDGLPCIACRKCMYRASDTVICFSAHGTFAAKIEAKLREIEFNEQESAWREFEYG